MSHAELTISRYDDNGAVCLPLSFAQQRLWFLNQLDPESPAYHISLALRLRGQLQKEVLEQVVACLVERHEVLRTNFRLFEGEPVQVIFPSIIIPLVEIDLCTQTSATHEQDIERLTAEFVQTPFNLTSDPLLRLRLVRLSANEHLLVVVMHHIIADGWSLGVFVQELSVLYNTFIQGQPSPLPELSIQYADFTIWQRQWLQGSVFDRQLDYWQTRLHTAPRGLALLTDHPHNIARSFQGATLRFTLPSALALAVRTLSKKSGTTLFMTLLAAFEVLLCRYSGQDDFVIGTVIANRNRLELEPLIGFFVNTLALRADTAGNPTFVELLQRVRHTALDAQAHQDLPFEVLVDNLDVERVLGINPLFQVLFVLENAPLPDFHLVNLDVSAVQINTCTSKFDLTLFVTERDRELDCAFEYATELFDRATIERMVQHFVRLLQGIVTNQQQSISDYRLLDEDEEHRLLLDWNTTGTPVPALAVHQLIGQNAAMALDRIALIYGAKEIRYEALESQSNQLAHHLLSLGIERGHLVGLFLDRSPSLIIALLAVLKAGAAFVPIDPTYPEHYFSFMLKDAAPRLVLTTSDLASRLTGLASATVLLDFDEVHIAAQPNHAPNLPVSLNDLAYVIYTSGSTGRPKGVMIEHRSIVNVAQWIATELGLGDGDRGLLKTPVSFDAAFREIFPVLITGGSLFITTPGGQRDPHYLAEVLRDQRISVFHCVPSLLRQLVEEPAFGEAHALRAVMCGGETLFGELARRFRERSHATLYNVYGPTETTVDSTYYRLDQNSPRPTVLIGRPIANTRIYILDEMNRPVPIGIAGQLHIGGVGVARGYLNAASLTAQRFSPNPFAPFKRERLYATGDRARYLADGNIEFLGRDDNQIKVSGIRIELAEIEQALTAHPSVQTAIAAVQTDLSGNRRLIAYVVPLRPNPLPSNTVRQNTVAGIASAIVEDWQSVFTHTYRQSAISKDPQTNTIGWNSSYTNAKLSAADMDEWIETTVSRLRSLRAHRILEIGCGTGLLLFRLAADCNRYVGVDFSPEALNYIRRHLTVFNLNQVELYECCADQIDQFNGNSFDLIIINSVIQYFPSLDYGRDVLDKAAALLEPDGVIFIGDVRDLRLQRIFHTSVQLFQAPDTDSAEDIRRRVSEQIWRDEELLVHPRFFLNWANTPPRSFEVQLEHKRGRVRNELTKFRYNVVLRRTRLAPLNSPLRRLDWQSQPLTVEGILGFLDEAPHCPAVVTGIVDARLDQDMAVHERLTDPQWSHWSAAQIRSWAQDTATFGIEPDDVLESIKSVKTAEAVIVATSQRVGCFDLVYRPPGISGTVTNLTWTKETDSPSDSILLANDPLENRWVQRITPELREYLATRLPGQMVPSRLFFLADLPLTPNGKLDRAALPAPDSIRPELSTDFVAPRTLIEQQLCQIWRDLLQIDQIGVHDDFFELGGHSLLATQVVSRLRDTFDNALHLRDFFEFPTIAGLARLLEKTEQIPPQHQQVEILRAARQDALPLSFAQQRLWFIDQMEPGNPVYTISHAMRVIGAFNLDTFGRAVTAEVGRQASLRTRFPEIDGVPSQMIDPAPVWVEVPLVDLSDLPKPDREKAALSRAHDQALQPFQLASGPLFRVLVFRLDNTLHLILVTMHHIISDGWSMGILLHELETLYNAELTGQPAALAPLMIQYADYAVWQRQQLVGDRLDHLWAYWREQLGEKPPLLQLPYDFPRPVVQSFQGARVNFTINPELTHRLKRFSQGRGATLFMTLLAAFQVLLHRLSNQDDFVIGTVIANRNLTAIEPLIGFFVNALPLRANLSGSPSFEEVMERTKQITIGAYEHQDLPFERLVELLRVDRNTNYQAVFQVLFVLQNTPIPEPELVGLSVNRVRIDMPGAMFDLSLELRETSAGIEGYLEFNTELFERRTTERLVARFCTLLRAALDDPNLSVSQLALLPPDEIREVMQFSTGPKAEYSSAVRLEALIEHQGVCHPDALAIRFDQRDLSFRTLNSAAEQLATRLVQAGVNRGELVGVCLTRSPLAIISLLAVLKAGAAFVYLDPAHPQERLRFVIQNASLEFIISDDSREPLLRSWGCRVFCVDNSTGRSLDPNGQGNSRQPQVSLQPIQESDAVAYVTYTSGSTGIPKAVLIPHQALVDRILANQQVLPPLTEADRFLHCYSFNYDGGIMSLFWPLAAGAAVIFAPLEELGDTEKLVHRLRTESITVIDSIPIVLRQLFRHPAICTCESLRHVITGGEACPSDLPALVLNQMDIHFSNQYGPSEATVNSTSWTCDRTTWSGQVLIGRPLPNTEVFILNQLGWPCPIGVLGELYIGGSCLAYGYLNQPAQTQERFIENPFVSTPHARLYRTGDLARLRNDRQLEFHGRLDRQVQIRGMRVELGEIETSLTEYPSVSEALVYANNSGNGDLELIAYVVPERDSEEEDCFIASLTHSRLREWTHVFQDIFSLPPSNTEARRNFVGWDSSYTGEPLSVAEMEEWLSYTVERIRSLVPRRVLEIGCGMGLLLFELVGEVEEYHAVDISSAALTYIHTVLQQQGITNVRLDQAFAHEISHFGTHSYDTIILNSVIQYFPNEKYLAQVLATAISLLRPEGHLFIGDVRHLGLQSAFHTAVQIARAPEDMTLSECRQRAVMAMLKDNELAVHPDYFLTLTNKMAEIADVGIWLKQGNARNELVEYRYDVVIRRGLPEADPQSCCSSPNWVTDGWSNQQLIHLLTVKRPLNFLIQQVPNARLQQILEALRLISMPQYQSESIGWLRATLTHTELTSAWHPEEVWTIAEQCGYQASLTWSAVVQDGSFDVLFVRADANTSQLKFSASFHREYCNRSEHLTSDPLHVWRSKKLVPKLREYLVNQLPRHMVPAKIICLHALLKTPGGKIDYGALPVSQVNEATLTEYAASPASLLEAEIAQIWADLLKVNNPSVHADFFALGGHSLLAAQLISRLRDYFGVNISVRQLFEAPTISRLATALSQLLTAGDDDKLRLNLLHLQKRSAPYLLSFSQETIWQRQQLAPNRLRQPIGFALQLSGSLELSALVQALKQVIARHQILRMRLRHSDKEPQPYYVPNDAIEIPLINAEAIDLMTDRGRIQDMLRERMRCPLDLEHKGPFSAEVIQLRRNTYALVLRLHPIAFDGWSVKVLFREIAAALAMQLNGLEATLPTLTLQYSDIARWERQLAVSGGFEAEVNYWQQQLAGVSGSLHLPAPPQSDMGEGHCEFVFERDLVAQVQALAVHKRVTLFTCCLSAYALALACITGVQDLLIVTTSANRRLLEVDEVIGPFANDVPLRLSLNPGNRYTDLLAHARERVIGALVYDNLPFDYLIQRLAQDLPEGYLPVPQTALVMHEEFTPLIDLPGISVSVLDSCGNVFHPFDVRMSLVLVQGELHGRVRFRRCVVDEEFVQTMIAEIQRYLATIAADPDGFIDL